MDTPAIAATPAIADITATATATTTIAATTAAAAVAPATAALAPATAVAGNSTMHPTSLFNSGQLPKKGDISANHLKMLGHFATDACPGYGGGDDEAGEHERQEALAKRSARTSHLWAR
jgi:hypothetical protein